MATAEKIRESFSVIAFKNIGHQTVSVGATQMHNGETADKICVRVDNALYIAKESGKNQVIWLSP